jgi:Arc/MetJ-type ribon-helix-helix transcriptional regulator
MTKQLAVRVDDDVAAEMETLVARNEFPNVTEIVRTALDEFLDRARRQHIGRQIVAGYRRVPADDQLDDLLEASGRDLAVSLEPWSWEE